LPSDDLRQRFQVAAQELAQRPEQQRKWALSLSLEELAEIGQGEYSTRIEVHDALGTWSYDAPPEPFAELREVCRTLYRDRLADG